jgi:hypothetical protein
VVSAGSADEGRSARNGEVCGQRNNRRGHHEQPPPRKKLVQAPSHGSPELRNTFFREMSRALLQALLGEPKRRR